MLCTSLVCSVNLCFSLFDIFFRTLKVPKDPPHNPHANLFRTRSLQRLSEENKAKKVINKLRYSYVHSYCFVYDIDY